MKSISFKILKATLLCLAVLVVMMSSVAVYVVTSITSSDSQALLTSVCEKETNRFNDEFSLLEHSVAYISAYMQSLEEEHGPGEYLLSKEFEEKVQAVSLGVANRTDGAMAVYFRYNPELTGNGTQGFFWSRNTDKERFQYVTPTDILKYDRHDTEHVGWFYAPQQKRQAVWMSPYYNKNLGVFMVSYVIPYYTRGGDFLGVVGMDIDFNKIMRLTDRVSLYQSGRASLIDLATYMVYSSDGRVKVEHEELTTPLYNHITTLERTEKVRVLTDNNGNAWMTCVGRLRNGMRLLLTVPVSEVNTQRDNMLHMFVLLMLVAFLVTALYIIKTTKKMVHPLKKLTRITGQYAEGDWTETYISHTGDEIQNLSESISVMAETTKSYIEEIHAKAATDELTGLKNKNCYLEYIVKFEAEQATGSEYALVVFDLNFLKKMNDNYGHELGDELIKRAGAYICHVFDHSPVFRIGGDEFTAVLENGDYERREELCAQFFNGMAELPPVAGDIRLSVSCGMASFPQDGSCFDEVFKRADERMYICKKRMKGGRE